MDITNLIQLKNTAELYATKISELQLLHAAAISELHAKCLHTQYTVEPKYHTGGYDYVSYIDIIETCVICNKVIRNYRDTSHRGSFQ